MILLRLISWPYARKHLVRWVLTIGGIVLGVALLVGMYTANQSVLEAFNRTVEHIAGKTQLQISAGDGGFAEDILERVESDPDVRVAAPVIEQVVDSGFKGQGKLLILAVDMTGDRSLRDYDLEGGDQDVMDDPLVFLAQPDSLILTRDFAARNGLTSGSKLAMKTMEGDKLFTVRGILRSGGMTSAFGGNLAIMDIYAAQKILRHGAAFRPHRYRPERRHRARPGTGLAAQAVGAGLRRRPARRARPAFRIVDGRVYHDHEHRQPVRPFHRHVHHL